MPISPAMLLLQEKARRAREDAQRSLAQALQEQAGVAERLESLAAQAQPAWPETLDAAALQMRAGWLERIGQLRALGERALAESAQKVAQARAELVNARVEERQVSILIERQRERERLAETRRERKLLDEMGTQVWLRHSHLRQVA